MGKACFDLQTNLLQLELLVFNDITLHLYSCILDLIHLLQRMLLKGILLLLLDFKLRLQRLRVCLMLVLQVQIQLVLLLLPQMGPKNGRFRLLLPSRLAFLKCRARLAGCKLSA